MARVLCEVLSHSSFCLSLYILQVPTERPSEIVCRNESSGRPRLLFSGLSILTTPDLLAARASDRDAASSRRHVLKPNIPITKSSILRFPSLFTRRRQTHHSTQHSSLK